MKAGKGLLTLLMNITNKEFVKYCLVGGLNTGITYLLYLFLLFFIPYKVSFTISYILGIVISYVLNSIFVFKQKLDIRKMIKYPIVYLVQYVLGVLLIWLFVEYLSIDKVIAPLISTILSVPLTFLVGKYIIKSKNNIV